jgi:hypothetical protein
MQYRYISTFEATNKTYIFFRVYFAFLMLSLSGAAERISFWGAKFKKRLP